MSKHTPGPWKYDPPFIVAPALRTRDAFTMVCEISDGDVPVYSRKTKHDAALIAAAPDLYAALKDLLSTIEAGDNDDDFCKAGFAAIAKAERKK